MDAIAIVISIAIGYHSATVDRCTSIWYCYSELTATGSYITTLDRQAINNIDAILSVGTHSAAIYRQFLADINTNTISSICAAGGSQATGTFNTQISSNRKAIVPRRISRNYNTVFAIQDNLQRRLIRINPNTHRGFSTMPISTIAVIIQCQGICVEIITRFTCPGSIFSRNISGIGAVHLSSAHP